MGDSKANAADNYELDHASASLLFKALLKQTQDQVYFKDHQSRFVKVSDIMVEKFGLKSVSELIGKSDFNFFALEHAQRTFDQEQTLMKEQKELINIIEKEVWPDGRITWVSSTKIPLKLKSGDIAGIMGITRDITSQIEAQQDLEKHRAMLQSKNQIMMNDLQNARTVQRLAIPGPIPTIPFAEIAVNIGSMNEVSGDLVTFPKSSDTHLSFFLGDVSGHGVSAGLFTLLIKHLVDRRMRDDGLGPAETLLALDKHLEGKIPDGFVAAFAGSLTREDNGNATLTLVNSCQPPVLIYRKDTKDVEIEVVESQSAIGLGICEAFTSKTIELRPGDSAVLMSDGAIECLDPDGNELGTEALASAFKRYATQAPNGIISSLNQFLKTYSGNNYPQDDTTLLVLQIKAATA